MKKPYSVENGDLIELALGNESIVTLMMHSGKLYRKVRIRRLDRTSVEVRFRDFDGCHFEIVANTAVGLAVLSVPCFNGSDVEQLYLEKIWNSAIDFINTIAG